MKGMRRASPTDQIIAWDQEGSPGDLFGSRIQKAEKGLRTVMMVSFECQLGWAGL